MVQVLKASAFLKFTGALTLALLFALVIFVSEASSQTVTASDAAVSVGDVTSVPLILGDAFCVK